MAPSACLTAAVTPSEPLAPVPVGQGTSLAAPKVHTEGATAVRYSVKTPVVPEPSDRWTTWMPMLGNEALGLSALMAASFHLVILPAKMPASVWPDSLRSLTPLRLYSTAMPPAVQGISMTLPAPPVADCSEVFNTTSEPAKSTVLAVSCWIPAPEPTD